MKKLLLLSSLILGSFCANAQLSCATAKDISTPGTYTVAAVAGSNATGGCITATTTETGGTLKGYWCKYMSATPMRVTISSDLDVNVAPKSTNTLVQILTGTCSALECAGANDDASATSKLSKISFTAEAGVTYYIMWSNYWSGAGFDFEIEANPCIQPSTVYLSTNITTTSATLNWEPAVGDPAQYEVVYADIAVTPLTFVSKIVDTNKADLNGLVNSGNYYFFIRSVCGVDSQSEYTGPFLLSLAKSVPYTSNFDTTNEIAPWKIVQEFPNYLFLVKDAPEIAQTKDNWYVSYNNIAQATNNWLYSPAISLKKGDVINASFYIGDGTKNADRSIKCTIGTEQIESEQKTTLYSNAALKYSPYTKITTSNFTAPETGLYYIGINDFSPIAVTEEEFLALDTFAVNSVSMAVEDFFSKQFTVYPNPANDLITITNSAALQVKSISINDFNGRIVKKEDFNNFSNVKFNVADLAAGVYFMNIQTDNGIATKKIIKN